MDGQARFDVAAERKEFAKGTARLKLAKGLAIGPTKNARP